jgi:hypothetical protein
MVQTPGITFKGGKFPSLGSPGKLGEVKSHSRSADAWVLRSLSNRCANGGSTTEAMSASLFIFLILLFSTQDQGLIFLFWVVSLFVHFN